MKQKAMKAKITALNRIELINPIMDWQVDEVQYEKWDKWNIKYPQKAQPFAGNEKLGGFFTTGKPHLKYNIDSVLDVEPVPKPIANNNPYGLAPFLARIWDAEYNQQLADHKAGAWRAKEK